MSKAVENFWIYNTCLIVNDVGSGTGFFVSDEEKKKIYLVTNKHVIHYENEKRNSIREIKLLWNIVDNDGIIKRDGISFTFNENYYREHPDNDTDIYVLDVTLLFLEFLNKFEVKPRIYAAPVKYLCTHEMIRKINIKITDEVFVIGYPSIGNLQHSTTNFPFVRQGIISSYIGDLLEDEIKEKNGSKRKRVRKGFLIDGGIIPGLSGAPVILKPTLHRELDDKTLFDTFPPVILGIVAETVMAFMSKSYNETYYSYANLGFAFDADGIRETIDLFYK